MNVLRHVYQTLQANLPELRWRISHPIKWLEQQPAYWRFRSRAKHLFKQIFLMPRHWLTTSGKSFSLTTEAWIPLPATAGSSLDDVYASITLLPPPPLNELQALLNRLPTTTPPAHKQAAPGPLSVGPDLPRVSLILVTYNNLALTHLCLMSLLRNTPYPDYEIIVVDNASTDDTPRYLTQLAQHSPHLRPILNSQNSGFAHANNQGLAQATGAILILLNNDTVAPPGWLARLIAYLAEPTVGLVGPVTNFAGNEARINVPYTTCGGMEAFAQERAAAYAGQWMEITVLAMYCLALRREVYEAVGPLDEQFGIGMFEDDDYAQRVRAQGYRVVCALDVFIHHVGQAAFGKLIPGGDYDRLFAENLRRYQAKWKVHWAPHPSPFVRSSKKPTAPAISKNR